MCLETHDVLVVHVLARGTAAFNKKDTLPG